MKKTAIIALTIALLAGCDATPIEKVSETPSGKPEALFRNTNLSIVSNNLLGLCAQVGASIDVADDNRVICRRLLVGSEAVMASVFLGNSYSTPPESVLAFTLVKSGSDVKVYADQYTETIMAFGQPKRANTMSNANFNIAMGAFTKLGGDPYPY